MERIFSEIIGKSEEQKTKILENKSLTGKEEVKSESNEALISIISRYKSPNLVPVI